MLCYARFGSVTKVIALLLLMAGRASFGFEQESLPRPIFHALEDGQSQVVVAYGTSVTAHGQWAAETHSYFDRYYPGQVKFFNAARSGRTSKWGVENLKRQVLDKHPDLVFLEFAINDAATKHGISTAECRDNLDEMVRTLRNANPNIGIVLQTMNPAWDSLRVPKSYGSDRPHLNDYYQVYRDYAQEHQLPLVDNYPVWKKILDDDPERFHRMVSDGIHPHSGPSREVAWPTIKLLLDKARALAGGELTVNVWPEGQMPGRSASEPETLRSPEKSDAIRITNISTPSLTFFPVEGLHEPAPLVIVCPGGGYSYVVVDKEGSEVARWLNALGVHAAVLKYRTPNKRADALQDLQRAISLVRSKAETWGVNPTRVGVIGFSAGGHLAARASNQFDARSYAAFDEVDAQSCRPDFAMLVYPAYLERDGKLSADLNLQADIPLTLIVHSDDDRKFIAGSRIYAAALEKSGHSFQWLNYPTGGHGYGLRSDRAAKVWPVDAEKWLAEQSILSREQQ